MSFGITLFGPGHYWWGNRAAWFHKPNKDATGGVGFVFVFIHVVFMWGYKRQMP